MSVEIFKDVIGFNRYTISNLGNVFDKKLNRNLIPYINGGYYCLALCNDNNIQKIMSIHRLIALQFIDNPNNYPCVDHIDQNKLNNNIENLRWCTHSQNEMNKNKMITNTTGFKGVSKRKNNKFETQIRYENTLYHIGTFNDALTAGYAYNVAAKLLFKKFACLNLIETPENYLQIKYLVFYKLSKHFDNIDYLVEKYKQFI
jgi:hypothetical protein